MLLEETCVSIGAWCVCVCVGVIPCTIFIQVVKINSLGETGNRCKFCTYILAFIISGLFITTEAKCRIVQFIAFSSRLKSITYRIPGANKN